NEGMVGTPVFLGADRSATKAVSQVAGQALKMRVDAFRRTLEGHPEFADALRRYTQAMVSQISQSTACNHVHGVRERMGRWLLMTHRRVGADGFHVTNERRAPKMRVHTQRLTGPVGGSDRSGMHEPRRRTTTYG